MGKPKITTRTSGDSVHATITGLIDQSAADVLDSLLAKPIAKLSLDLRGVSYINSAGARAWISSMKELTKNGEVTLVACSPAMVHQMSLLPGLWQKAKVASVTAPFTCAACGKEFDHEVLAKDFPAPGAPALQAKCPSCRSTSEMQLELQDEYFTFHTARK